MTAALWIDINRLRELLAYDQETGVFTWLVGRKKASAGSLAGSQNSRGYMEITIERKKHYAHRLAWAYVHGHFPKGQIDHRDGDRSNNSISNLRDATSTINNQNKRGPRSDNKSGFLGVSKHGRQWRAEIMICGENLRLGLFNTPELAHTAYINAKRQHHAGCTI